MRLVLSNRFANGAKDGAPSGVLGVKESGSLLRNDSHERCSCGSLTALSSIASLRMTNRRDIEDRSGRDISVMVAGGE